MLSFRKNAALAAASALGVLAFTAPASAAPAAPVTSALTGITLSAVPNVSIYGTPPAWHPGKLSVRPRRWSGSCGPRKAAWTVTNKTKRTLILSYSSGSARRHRLGSLAAGRKGDICVEGRAGARVYYYIRHQRSVLHVTLK
jgi:hypothetical protein